jgi:predicted DNA-binding transcriptional regulator AlpA
MTETIQKIIAEAGTVPASSLPGFIAGLAEANAVALQRLVTPVAQPAKQADRLLSVSEAAALLGCGKSILYHGRLALTPRRVGRRLMFSEVEIQSYISKRG